jgi:hypothetical protein
MGRRRRAHPGQSVIDLGVRIGGRAVLLELNGVWLTVDVSKRRAITVEFGRVAIDALEPAERPD